MQCYRPLNITEKTYRCAVTVLKTPICLSRLFHTCASLFLSIFRIGLSEDIGGAVSFLSSDQASYITGETLVIGGGLQSRLWIKLYEPKRHCTLTPVSL